MLYDVVGPANHHAVAAFEAPDAAAGAYVGVIDFVCGEIFGAANIIDVIGIAAINEDVTRIEKRCEISKSIVHHGGRDHQPNGARFGKFFYEFVERIRAFRAFGCHLLDAFGISVEGNAFVAATHEPAHHVRAHAAEADHAHLHLLGSSITS